jgi:chorismate mutase
MIESHICPSKAWSDAKQQITPNDLVRLLKHLKLRAADIEVSDFLDFLRELRNKIDIYDEQMLDLFEQRMKISETIGKCKKENNITILQSIRFDRILRKAIIKGEKKGLSAEFIDKLFKAIHQESMDHQKKVMNQIVHT